jgi:mono/diheme cytochrome c family protein
MRAAITAVMLCGCSARVDDEARARARAVWEERCVQCHGARGEGDGPGARTAGLEPRNLRDVSWQSQTTDERIARVIVDGGQPEGLSPLMPANPDLQRDPAVVAALVELVRGL